MTNEELKQALMKNATVRYIRRDGTVSNEMKLVGLIYRSNGKGKIDISAELLCETGNSVVVCSADRVLKK